MRLHTFHDPNFDICSNQLDYSKSPHYRDDYLKEAYDWLFGLIGTNEVIWCHDIAYQPSPLHGVEKKEWILEVPEDNIIKRINIHVWDCVIMKGQIIPDDVYTAWTKELREMYPGHIPTDEQDTQFFNKKEAEWEQLMGPMTEQWKNGIFSNSEDGFLKHEDGFIEYLIPSPVPKEWVIDVKHCSGYNLQFDEDTHGVFFENKEDADRFVMLIHSFMKHRNKQYEVKLVYRNDGEYTVDLEHLWDL